MDIDHAFTCIDFSTGTIRGTHLFSRDAVLGSEVIIWDQFSSFTALASGRPSDATGKNILDRASADLVLERISARSEQFQKHLQAGKTLVILTGPTPGFIYTPNTGGYTHLDTSAILPKEIRFFVNANRGKNGEYVTQAPFQDLGKVLTNAGEFNGTLRLPKGFKSLGCIRGHDTEIVAAYGRILGGHCFVLPSVPVKARDGLLLTLLNLHNELTQEKTLEPLPEWVRTLTFETEKPIHAQIQEIDKQIEEKKKDRLNAEALLKEFENYRTLLGGKSDPLRLGVANIFRSLGFKVSDVDSRKEDLILEKDQFVAAVEVKGKKGTSGSSDRRQLQDWVNQYALKFDRDPKGILIVNGFNELPPDKRSENVFPDEMLEMSTAHGHCLMTTVQLLAEYLAINEGSNTTDDFVSRLIATSGRFQSKFDLSRWIKPTEK